MDEFEIKVKGKTRTSTVTDIVAFLDRLEKGFKALAMKPKLVAGVSVAAFVMVIGTPHVGLQYRCGHRTTYSTPCREYLSCWYLGILGWQEIKPRQGEQCGAFRMLTPDWARLLNRR